MRSRAAERRPGAARASPDRLGRVRGAGLPARAGRKALNVAEAIDLPSGRPLADRATRAPPPRSSVRQSPLMSGRCTTAAGAGPAASVKEDHVSSVSASAGLTGKTIIAIVLVVIAVLAFVAGIVSRGAQRIRLPSVMGEIHVPAVPHGHGTRANQDPLAARRRRHGRRR